MDALLQLKESLADRYDIKREIGAGGMATSQSSASESPSSLRFGGGGRAVVLRDAICGR